MKSSCEGAAAAPLPTWMVGIHPFVQSAFLRREQGVEFLDTLLPSGT